MNGTPHTIYIIVNLWHLSSRSKISHGSGQHSLYVLTIPSITLDHVHRWLLRVYLSFASHWAPSINCKCKPDQQTCHFSEGLTFILATRSCATSSCKRFISRSCLFRQHTPMFRSIIPSRHWWLQKISRDGILSGNSIAKNNYTSRLAPGAAARGFSETLNVRREAQSSGKNRSLR